jgi:hypothetical protein
MASCPRADRRRELNNVLEEAHCAWLIQTSLRHANREISRINPLIDEGRIRYPALHGCIDEIQERWLPS